MNKTNKAHLQTCASGGKLKTLINNIRKVNDMKKIVLSLCLIVLSIFFISCTLQKKYVSIRPVKLMLPIIYSLDSTIYLCRQYTLFYPKRNHSEFHKREIYKREKREVCTCHTTIIRLLEWNITNAYSMGESYGKNTLIIWDSNFVSNYILPLFREEKDRKRIEYTLANSDENTFKNIIDYDNKVIIDDKVYYYHLKIKQGVSVMVEDYKWLKSVVPKSSWIYEPNCFYDGEKMAVDLLIPLLDYK